jgi:hypothetical protein
MHSVNSGLGWELLTLLLDPATEQERQERDDGNTNPHSCIAPHQL